jgi:hypothetical protein
MRGRSKRNRVHGWRIIYKTRMTSSSNKRLKGLGGVGSGQRSDEQLHLWAGNAALAQASAHSSSRNQLMQRRGQHNVHGVHVASSSKGDLRKGITVRGLTDPWHHASAQFCACFVARGMCEREEVCTVVSPGSAGLGVWG